MIFEKTNFLLFKSVQYLTENMNAAIIHPCIKICPCSAIVNSLTKSYLYLHNHITERSHIYIIYEIVYSNIVSSQQFFPALIQEFNNNIWTSLYIWFSPIHYLLLTLHALQHERWWWYRILDYNYKFKQALYMFCYVIVLKRRQTMGENWV